MSELSQAINEMRNMRESYNQIAVAAEAYNTGKVQLAENITSKGVEASATETLPALAEKVNAIAQETYQINGGEMYAKQLFGSLETPNYWNLYDVLEQLLSDGRLASYGGILLAEYYRGYDSFALSGAGAGGAYVVSDKDENGQFKMYTEDTTHVWATEFDGKGNRWVAYCFAGEYHDFQITNTNTSPRSIFIGRKVGTITSLVAGRISQIVVPDGNELYDFVSSYSQNWSQHVILRNIQHHSGNLFTVTSSYTESIYVEGKIYGGNIIANEIGNSNSAIKTVVFKGYANGGALFLGEKYYVGLNTVIVSGEYLNIKWTNTPGWGTEVFSELKDLVLYGVESVYFTGQSRNIGGMRTYISYITNDKTKSVQFSSNGWAGMTKVELKEGWCKPLQITGFTSLTKENVQTYIFDRLGVNDLSTGAVTIRLANAVLKLFTQEEIDAVVERTHITIVGA